MSLANFPRENGAALTAAQIVVGFPFKNVKGGDFSVRSRQGYRAPKDETAEEKDQNKKSGN